MTTGVQTIRKHTCTHTQTHMQNISCTRAITDLHHTYTCIDHTCTNTVCIPSSHTHTHTTHAHAHTTHMHTHYTHTHTHTRTHTHTHTHTHTLHTQHTRVRTHTHTLIHTHKPKTSSSRPSYVVAGSWQYDVILPTRCTAAGVSPRMPGGGVGGVVHSWGRGILHRESSSHTLHSHNSTYIHTYIHT